MSDRDCPWDFCIVFPLWFENRNIVQTCSLQTWSFRLARSRTGLRKLEDGSVTRPQPSQEVRSIEFPQLLFVLKILTTCEVWQGSGAGSEG